MASIRRNHQRLHAALCLSGCRFPDQTGPTELDPTPIRSRPQLPRPSMKTPGWCESTTSSATRPCSTAAPSATSAWWMPRMAAAFRRTSSRPSIIPANYLVALEHTFTPNLFNETKFYINRSPFHNPQASALPYAVNTNNFRRAQRQHRRHRNRNNLWSGRQLDLDPRPARLQNGHGDSPGPAESGSNRGQHVFTFASEDGLW